MLTYLTNNYNKANTHFCHTTERAFLYDYKQIHIRSAMSKLAMNWRYKLPQNRTLLSNIQLSKIKKILSNQWLFFCRLTTPINYTNLCAVDWTKRVLYVGENQPQLGRCFLKTCLTNPPTPDFRKSE